MKSRKGKIAILVAILAMLFIGALVLVACADPATPTHNITWNLAEGQWVTAPATTVADGGDIAEPTAPTRDGYSFDGWFTAATGGEAVQWPVTNVTAAKAFYARWTREAPTHHNITWNLHGGEWDGEAPPASVVAGGTIAEPEEPIRPDYDFVGWFTAATGGTEINWPVTNVTAAQVFHAQWEEDTGVAMVSVTWNLQDGTWVGTPPANEVEEGGTINLPTAPTRTGYTFDGWFTEATGGDAITWPVTNVTQAQVFYAQWTEIPQGYNQIVWNLAGGAWVGTPPAETVEDGGTIEEPTAPTRTGYTFDGWFTAATGGDAITWPVENVTQAQVFYAQWTEIAFFDITWNLAGGEWGAVQPPTQVEEGGTINLPAAPTRTGHTFDGWFTAETGGDAIDWPVTNVAGNQVFWAQWTEIPPDVHLITWNLADGAWVSGAEGPLYVEDGGNIELPTAPTRDGYMFVGWFTAPTGGTAITWPVVDVAGPQTFYARWDAIPVRDIAVVLNTNNLEWTENNITVTFTVGVPDAVTLPVPTGAQIPTGFAWGGWFLNEQLTGDPVTELTSTLIDDLVPASGVINLWGRWVEIDVESVTIDGGATQSLRLDAGAAARQLSATVAPAGANSAVTWSSTNGAVATIDSNGLLTLLTVGSTTITATSVHDPSVAGMMTLTVTAIPCSMCTQEDCICVAITSVAEFNAMFTTTASRAGFYYLANDLDFEGANTHWAAGWQTAAGAFSGVFDGRGLTIRNVNIHSGYTAGFGHTGLFPRITGTVSNFSLVGVTTGNSGVAGQSGFITPNLAGDGVIENVFIQGTSSWVNAGWGAWGANGIIAGITEAGEWRISNVVADVSVAAGTIRNVTAAIRTGGTMENIFVRRTGGQTQSGFSDGGTYATIGFAGPTVVDATTDFSALSTDYWTLRAGDVPILNNKLSLIPSISRLYYSSQSTIDFTIVSGSAVAGTTVLSSSNLAVATVDGLVATITGIGTVTITVTIGDGYNRTATTTITVLDPYIAVESITLTASATTMNLAGVTSEITITAAVLPENATNRTITFTAGNGNVAVVAQDGVAGTATVQARGAGTSSVVATSACGQITGTVDITEITDTHVGVGTAEEFQNMNIAGSYFLIGDIDFYGFPFVPIGGGDGYVGWSAETAFSGTLYGNGYALQNITTATVGGANWFFGGVFRFTNGATISNLSVENITVTSDAPPGNHHRGQSGLFVGDAVDTTFENISVEGSFMRTNIGGDPWMFNSGFAGMFRGTSQARNIVIDAVSGDITFHGFTVFVAEGSSVVIENVFAVRNERVGHAGTLVEGLLHPAPGETLTVTNAHLFERSEIGTQDFSALLPDWYVADGELPVLGGVVRYITVSLTIETGGWFPSDISVTFLRGIPNAVTLPVPEGVQILEGHTWGGWFLNENFDGDPVTILQSTLINDLVPESGTIPVWGRWVAIPVTGISVSQTQINLIEGTEATIVATIAPANAYNQGVNWWSEDGSVATVGGDGVITAVSEGVTTIFAQTEDGNFIAEVEVTVVGPYSTIQHNFATPISTPECFLLIRQNMSGVFYLTNDIDFGGAPMTRIPFDTAAGESNANAFTGVLDGRGFTVSNFTSLNTGARAHNSGIFAQLGVSTGPGIAAEGTNGIIRNIAFTGVTVTNGAQVVGGVVGTNHGLIENVFFQGSVVSTGGAAWHHVGGIVAANDPGAGGPQQGIVNNSVVNLTTTTPAARVGAVAGWNAGASTNNFFATDGMNGSTTAAGDGDAGTGNTGFLMAAVEDNDVDFSSLPTEFWDLNDGELPTLRQLPLSDLLDAVHVVQGTDLSGYGYAVAGAAIARAGDDYSFTVTVDRTEIPAGYMPRVTVMVGSAERILDQVSFVGGAISLSTTHTFVIEALEANIVIESVEFVPVVWNAISTTAEFQEMTLTGFYYLENDIDFGFNIAGETIRGDFVPIGNQDGAGMPNGFRGYLDGRGYSVSNLNIVGDAWGPTAIFSGLNGAAIKNVAFVNVGNSGANRPGLLSTSVLSAHIENVFISGVIHNPAPASADDWAQGGTVLGGSADGRNAGHTLVVRNVITAVVVTGDNQGRVNRVFGRMAGVNADNTVFENIFVQTDGLTATQNIAATAPEALRNRLDDVVVAFVEADIDDTNFGELCDIWWDTDTGGLPVLNQIPR